jgi:hypothetical protein
MAIFCMFHTFTRSLMGAWTLVVMLWPRWIRWWSHIPERVYLRRLVPPSLWKHSSVMEAPICIWHCRGCAFGLGIQSSGFRGFIIFNITSDHAHNCCPFSCIRTKYVTCIHVNESVKNVAGRLRHSDGSCVHCHAGVSPKR